MFKLPALAINAVCMSHEEKPVDYDNYSPLFAVTASLSGNYHRFVIPLCPNRITKLHLSNNLINVSTPLIGRTFNAISFRL